MIIAFLLAILTCGQDPSGAASGAGEPTEQAPLLVEIGQPAPPNDFEQATENAHKKEEDKSELIQSSKSSDGSGQSSIPPELLGSVLLIHIVDPSSPTGISDSMPLLRDIVSANKDRGIEMISLLPQGEAASSLIDRLELDWQVHQYPSDSKSPYLAAGIPRANYLWIIDRSGFLVWKGDPQKKEKEWMKVLTNSLNLAGAPSTERKLDPALNKAVAAYLDGDWQSSKRHANKLRKKHKNISASQSAIIAEDSRHMAAIITEHEVALMHGAFEALEKRRPLTYLELLNAIHQGFSKSDIRDQVEDREKEFRKRMGNASSLDDAKSLREVLSKRPLLFPSRKSRAGDKLKKELEQFLKRSSNDIEPTQKARWLLERYSMASTVR